jgi:GTP-binding protein HflX
MPRVKAFVLHVTIPGHGQSHARDDRSERAQLEEAVGLALAIDLDIQGQQSIHLAKVSPRTLIGQGMVETLTGIIKQQAIGLVVVDAPLTPVQQRNLEKIWACKVIDRTGLILEIFGERARTSEGRLQVELARLTYQRSRLVRSWTHLERQRGGFGFTGGPGESQLELDRRLIGDRIIKIKKSLEQAKKTRGLHRQARQRIPYPIVALVGYTNAGKSTLFNTLTKAQVFAENLLFATLDPTMRLLKLPSGREVIFSDTVGFISNLPTTLIAAFRATLEEVTSADLILHIRDCSHPDTLFQAQEVEKILGELGLQHIVDTGGLIDVFNKMDCLEPEALMTLQNRIQRESSAVGVSALKGQNLPQLLALIDRRLGAGRKTVKVSMKAQQGSLLAWCYRRGAILERNDEDGYIHLTLQLDPADIKRFWELYHTGK